MKNLYIAIIFSLLCAGCIIIPIPIPEHSPDAAYRAPIKKESLEFIEVGSTKREEVLLTLGPPDCTQENERVFDYQWETESEWIYVVGAGYQAAGGTFHFSLTYQLLIEFDDTGIVKRFEIKRGKVGATREKLF